MRIAYITPEFITEAYYSGGLANYLNRIGLALAARGHTIHILVRAQRDESFTFKPGIAVHRVALADASTLAPATFPQAPDVEAWLCFSMAAYLKIESLHTKYPFDIIQAPNSRGCGVFTMLRTSIPVITRISCYRPLWNKACCILSTLDTKGIEATELLQLKLSKHIFAPSRKLAQIVEKEAGIKTVEVLKTPAYVEISQEDTTLYERHLKNRRYILYVGRYQKHKGFDVLVHALKSVLRKNPALHAVFVGMDTPGESGQSMKKWAIRELENNTNRLIFIGQTNHDKLYPIIRKADLVILPSIVDNLPNTCLEAMMLGSPVIGTQGASFEELILDGKNGFLVPPGNHEQLARTITAALQRSNLKKIGRAAKQSVSDLNPERIAQEHETYYQRVLGIEKS